MTPGEASASKHVRPAHEAGGSASRALVLFNPVSGRGTALQSVELARPILEAGGLDLEVVATSHGGSSPSVVATLEAAELVIVAG